MHFSVVSVLQSMTKNRSVPKPRKTEMLKKSEYKRGREGRGGENEKEGKKPSFVFLGLV